LLCRAPQLVFRLGLGLCLGEMEFGEMEVEPIVQVYCNTQASWVELSLYVGFLQSIDGFFTARRYAERGICAFDWHQGR